MLSKKQRVILFSKKNALVREGGFGLKNYDGELG